ncbi:MAG: twin-arginine translocation pathway signal protein [Rubrivivax sp. SCN 71-131]|nr:MAG: twin-arginine translocation pathway signal protein [Rubrivivax sp. SCN 71-131]
MVRPNIIYIVADDLGAFDLGSFGADAEVSPNLDRLAREGLRFTRAYSNSPVCSPARFGMLTGRWQYRLRAAAEEPLGRRSQVLGLPPEHPTLPSLLRDAGYATALIGKWHLGQPPLFGPLKSGYDEFFGPLGGAVDYFSHLGPSGAHDLWEGEREVHLQGYLTDLISDRAVEYVARERAGQPFFLSVNYTSPHWPWETRDDAAESARIGAAIAHLDGGSIATYRRMIQHMDEGIGRIVAALPPGQRENTLVVFVSDNGGERFSNNWPFIGGKMDLLEGGIRVPQIAWWPASIAAGQVSDTPTLTMDWMPTMLAAAGVAPHPDHAPDGVDLAPLFADPAWAPERQLYWRMKHRQQAACVAGPWKYLRVDGHEYLFDVIADARERANLGKRFPERLAAMRASWNAWASTMPAIPEDAQVHLLWDERDMPRPTH